MLIQSATLPDNNHSKNKQNHRGRITREQSTQTQSIVTRNQIFTFLTSEHRYKKPNTHIPDLRA